MGAVAGPRIDAGYPGGNIVVERVDGDEVYLHQDQRDTARWWFYWNFRVRGGGGRRLTFHFTNKDVVGRRGPAVSLDRGVSWSWLGRGNVRTRKGGVSFSYEFPQRCGEVRFCYTFPYVASDLVRFLKKHAGSEHLEVAELCRSREGRPVTKLRLGRVRGEAAHRVFITCRSHACESMASHVLEGALAGILAETDEGAWLREHVEFLVIPFVDTDGVEDGDQGKARKPRDHNRDYKGDSLYPETRAIRELVPQWSGGRMRISLDMHCPWIREQNMYQVGAPRDEIWREQQAFGRLLEREASKLEALPYRTSRDVPWGKRWNTPKNFTVGLGISQWSGAIEGVRIATTLEIPYSVVGKTTITAANTRLFGRALAAAIRVYLDR
jgi:hypothetical protein